jgi:hypothetical protein
LNALKARLPTYRQSLPVFSTIIFIEFTWSLYRLFNQLPSWLFYMNLGEVLVLVAYVLVYALAESLLILVFLLVIAFLLPEKVFRRYFIPQGTLIALVIGAAAIYFQNNFSLLADLDSARGWLAVGIALAVLLLLLLGSALIFNRFKLPGRLITRLGEQMTIFFYIYAPISLLSLTIVLFRNIF